MVVTVLGIVTDFSFSHPTNVRSSISVTLYVTPLWIRVAGIVSSSNVQALPITN